MSRIISYDGGLLPGARSYRERVDVTTCGVSHLLLTTRQKSLSHQQSVKVGIPIIAVLISSREFIEPKGSLTVSHAALSRHHTLVMATVHVVSRQE